MSSIGTGYDLAASTFSPDGRIFQVEYAQKCVDNSCSVFVIRSTKGVLMVADKPVNSKLTVTAAHPRVCNLDEFTGFASSGLYPDSMALKDYCTSEAVQYLKQYRQKMPLKQMAQQLAEYTHYFTLGVHRPYGASAFLCRWTKEAGGQIFLVEPSGTCFEYKAWAIGKQRQAIKAEIEKMKYEELDMEDLVKIAARAAVICRGVDFDDPDKLKIEMLFAGEYNDGKFAPVPQHLIENAAAAALAEYDE
ncbi:hypothetical protein L596_028629 [Steinernema carpocapsae]|uniref:Proteasome alpha-type subunits domain-containing protein n=1 Tax=Steinernema carpocapsae TaxID=34508 RepID=A0A4U5LYZ5_STECR|nr:hypothetical protein L596_028629 [Steinernema carpocapsae]